MAVQQLYRQSEKKSDRRLTEYHQDFVSITKGVTFDKEDQEYSPTRNVVLTADNITLDGKFDVVKKIYVKETKVFPTDKELRACDILICFSSGSKKHVGKVAFIKENTDYYAGGFMGVLRSDSSVCISQYLYYILNNSDVKLLIRNESGGSNIYNLSNQIGYIPVPVPPLEIQKQIVSECEKVDDEYNTARRSIEDCRQKIEDLFSELEAESIGGEKLSLANSEKFDVIIGQRVLKSELVKNGSVPVYSANVFEPFGYVDELLITDFSRDSVLWGIDGDWLVNCIPKDNQFYPTDHCGVLRCKTDEVNPKYLAHVLESEGRKMGFSRAYRASIDRVQGISFYVPDITKQNEAAQKIALLEAKIAEAEKKLETLPNKTAEILNRYLR